MSKIFKAREKATGRIFDVKEWRGSSDVFYTSIPDMICFIESELEFLGKSENADSISFAILQKVLAQAVEMGYINEYSSHRIMNLVKEELKNGM